MSIFEREDGQRTSLMATSSPVWMFVPACRERKWISSGAVGMRRAAGATEIDVSKTLRGKNAEFQRPRMQHVESDPLPLRRFSSLGDSG